MDGGAGRPHPGLPSRGPVGLGLTIAATLLVSGGAAGGRGQGALGAYPLDEETAEHWRLPRRLAEISGLALTDDGRLLAHHDEAGVVFELDVRDGSVVKEFQVADGANAIHGDFEGIATADGWIYLVTSAGRIYEFREGADGASVLFTAYATGVGRDCEIEGLAHDPGRRALLLLCKQARGAGRGDRLAIHVWSLADRRLDRDARIPLAVRDFAEPLGASGFHPSGIARHPQTGTWFVVAARQQAAAEITPGGRVLAVRRFPARWHRQIEGITFGPDGALVVSDEGAGGRARLTAYPAPSGRGPGE